MFKLFLSLILMCMTLFCAAEVSFQKNNTGISLTNEFIRVRINAVGGRIEEFTTLADNTNYVPESTAKNRYGLNQFRFMEDRRKSLLQGKYRLTVKKSADTVTVTADMQMPKGVFKGYHFRRIYQLKSGEVRLKCTQLITAASGRHEKVTPWFSNFFDLGSDPEIKKNIFIASGRANEMFNHKVLNDTSVHGTFPGTFSWLAVVNASGRKGMTITGDKNFQSNLYFWMGSEHFFTAENITDSFRAADDVRKQETIFYAPYQGRENTHWAAPEYSVGLEKGKLLLYPAIPLENAVITCQIGKQKSVTQKFASLDAGKIVSLKVNVPQGFFDVKLSIKSGKFSSAQQFRANIKHGRSEIQIKKGLNISKSVKQAPIAMSHAKDRLYLSNRYTIVNFALSANKVKSTKYAVLNIEVPENITLFDNPKFSAVTPITRNGQKFTRYSYKLRPRSYYAALSVAMKSSQPFGSSSDIWYYAQLNDTAQKPQKLPVTTVDMAPHCRRLPKRLLAGVGFYRLDLLQKWPGLAEIMRECGSNTLSFRNDNDVPAMSKIVEDARMSGMYVKVNAVPAAARSRLLNKYPDSRSLAPDGTPGDTVCPSYRGPGYAEEMEMITAYADSGASIVFWDTESWNRREFCFCRRCVKLFEKWFAVNGKNLPYHAPAAIINQPEKYPEHFKLWQEFRIDLGVRYFGSFQKKYVERLKKSGRSNNMTPPGMEPIFGLYGVYPGRGIYHHFMRFEEFQKAGVVNVAMPSCYWNDEPARVGEMIGNLRKKLGNSRIVPFITAGGSRTYECDARTLKYVMLEVFLNGAMGFANWPYLGWDAQDLKMLSEVMNMVRPLEDIIVDGRPIENLKVSGEAAKAVGLQLKNEIAILLTDYSRPTMPKQVLTLTVPQACKLFDVASGEKLADLKAGKNTVKLSAYPDQARLLYVGESAPDTDFKCPPSANELNSAPAAVSVSMPEKRSKEIALNKTENVFTVRNAFYSVNIDRKTGVIQSIKFQQDNYTLPAKNFNNRAIFAINRKKFRQLSAGKSRVIAKSNGNTVSISISGELGSASKIAPEPVNASIQYTFTGGSPFIKAEFTVVTEHSFSRCRMNSFTFRLPEWKEIISGPQGNVQPVPQELTKGFKNFRTAGSSGVTYMALADEKNHAIAIFSRAPNSTPAATAMNNKQLILNGFQRKISPGIHKLTQYIYLGRADKLQEFCNYFSSHF